jgi:hypothetical protein
VQNKLWFIYTRTTFAGTGLFIYLFGNIGIWTQCLTLTHQAFLLLEPLHRPYTRTTVGITSILGETEGVQKTLVKEEIGNY